MCSTYCVQHVVTLNMDANLLIWMYCFHEEFNVLMINARNPWLLHFISILRKCKFSQMCQSYNVCTNAFRLFYSQKNTSCLPMWIGLHIISYHIIQIHKWDIIWRESLWPLMVCVFMAPWWANNNCHEKSENRIEFLLIWI